MDIIEELKYYCNELQPVGALMLTGEWGCGKTYLLNNILKDAIEDTHIILRVSLFGLESIEEVHKEVKKCWFYAFSDKKSARPPVLGEAVNQEVVPVPMNLVAPAEEPCIKKLLPESVKGSSLEFDFHGATLRVTDQTSDALLAKVLGVLAHVE